MKKLVLTFAAIALVAAVFFTFDNRPAPEAQAEVRPQNQPLAASSQPQTSSAPCCEDVQSANHSDPSHAAPVDVIAPGPPRRAWGGGDFAEIGRAGKGATVEFELTDGTKASGVVNHVERKAGEAVLVVGILSVPEQGRFFFQKQTMPGKQGDFAGVVEFSQSKKAFRIEPHGANGALELVARRLDEVICLLPPANPAILAAEAEQMPPLDPSDFPDYPIPAYQDGIIPLQSLPGATGVLYIDYRGGYTPTWGGITYEKPNVSNAQIKDVWKRVAEDYMPFNINVTTDIKVYQSAPETSRQRVICTPTTTAAPGAGGVAYLNSWNWSGDTPCWSFYSTGKSAAEVISHEAGHTLQLGHDGTSTTGYYSGQGSGSVGWAPIMGVGYYKLVAQWSKGEYTDANNTQDDLAIIVGNNNSVDYRADDAGGTLATSRYLEVYSDNTVFAEGVVETSGDTDAFQFTTAGGGVSLRADPAPGDWANLAIMATLADASDTVIASNNPQSQLWASIATNLPAGTYTFRVTGAGRNNPLTDGFSSYASLGYYSISGSVTNARMSSRFNVAENSTNGTTVGTITVTNPGIDPLVYAIASGNAGGAFAVNSNGVLRVSNSSMLNYEALAQNTQLTVQYELFVNITNLANPALTELNRRVLVRILDANEAPSAAGFTNMILAATQPGTVIGTVAGSDPDFYTILNYSILGGNTNNVFAIGLESGVVTVSGNLTPAFAGTYNLPVQVTDGFTNVVTNVRITVAPNNSPFLPGSISYATYDGIGNGSTISDLTNHARFPTDSTWEQQRTLFEGDTDRADNYGSVMRGYLIPPVSGSYTFFIATDDAGELWISPSTNPASMTLAASVSGWTSPRQWTKYSSQTSTNRNLVAGQAYYIEARHKEGGGGDNLAVAWKGPATSNLTNVIGGLYLAPYLVNYVPHAVGFTRTVRRDTFPGTPLGRVSVTDVNATDLHSWAITSGNAENIFGVNTDGYILATNAAGLAASATSTFTLTVQVTDNGSPALSTTASVVLNIIEPDVIAATQIQREMFNNIGSGSAVSDLTSNGKYPGRPDSLTGLGSFASAVDVADAYGSRIRACVVPPITGDYQFFIASDDASQLKFSYDTNPGNATVIASVSGWTGAGEWTKNASQTSGLITNLQAGQPYYIEALQKEGGGGDHVSVAWLVPGSNATNVIGGADLRPVDLGYAPAFSSQSFNAFQTVANGASIGTVTATDSPLDTITFQILGGNTNRTFALDPVTGAMRVADNSLITSGAVTNFILTVAAQDSGYGGLFPLRATTNTVTISITGTNVPFVWNGGGSTNLWSDAGNWAGGILYPGVRIIFGQPFRQSNVNDAITNASWVQFNTGGFSITGNPVTLQSGLTNAGNTIWGVNTTLGAAQTWLNSSGFLTISGNVTNAGSTLSIVANGDTSISGVISGTGGLSKTGNSRLLMQGAHSYTGPTTIGAASGMTTALEVNGTGDLDIPGSAITMNGRMDLWNHNATLGSLAGSGLIFANDSARTLTVGANNGSGTFSGIIQNSSWGSGVTLKLVKTGSGIQTLSGANTYSGGTVLRAGQISFSNGGALGSGSVTLCDAFSGSTNVLLLATAAVTAPNNITVATQGSGVVTIGSDNATLSANIQYGGILTLNRDATLQAGSSDRTTFGGQITGTGNLIVSSPFAASRRIVFDRSSGAANDFLGDLTIGAGADLQIGVANSIGNRTLPDSVIVKFNAGSRLRLAPAGSGDSETLGALQSLSAGGGSVDMFTGTAFTLTVGGGNASGSFSGSIINSVGSLALVKSGTGIQILAGANTYSGATTVSNGTLQVNGSLAAGSAVTVNTNAMLGGTGVVNGATTIAAGGSLAPGASTGTLTVSNALTVNTGANVIMEISRNGATLTNDLLKCTGTLTCAGTLTVTNIGADALQAGNSFKLFNVANYAALNFTATNLPLLTNGLAWDLSALKTSGTVSVIATEPSTPPTLAVQVAGGSLTISWPTNYTSYILKSQTNSLSAGLSATWFPVSGVLNNRYTVSIHPANPSVFYRLFKP